jgi:ankyrin repeat protein
VANGILLGCPLFLPVHTVNCVQTLKATQLLAEGVTFPDVKDEEGCTTLFHACVNGHLDVAMVLLDHGCNIDALNDQMHSALSATYFTARAKGGSLDQNLLGENYAKYLGENGSRANEDVLDLVLAELLRRGANPNVPRGGGSALSSAVRGKDLFMVRCAFFDGHSHASGCHWLPRLFA